MSAQKLGNTGATLEIPDSNPNAPDPTGYDHNRDLELGGSAGGYANDAARFGEASGAAAKQAAPSTDWSGGDKYGALADGSRAGTTDALSLMRDRANGIHTASDAMANRGNAIATGTNTAILRGGRGAAAIAGAGQQAAGTASRMATDNTNNKAITNAADTALAQQQLAQGYGQQRGLDASQQHVLDTRSQYDADLAMRQQGLNDQGQMGWERMRFGANASGLAGQQAAEDANYNDWAQRSSQHEQVAGMDQAQAMKYGGAAANGLGTGIGYAANQGVADPGYDYSNPGSDNGFSRQDPYGNPEENGFSRHNPYGTSDKRAKQDIKDESALRQPTQVTRGDDRTRSQAIGDSLLPVGAAAAAERLKDRSITSGAEKSFNNAAEKASNGLGGFVHGTADGFMEGSKRMGVDNFVRRVSLGAYNGTAAVRHATGADKNDTNPDIVELGHMPAKGSVRDMLKAYADKDAREAAADQQRLDEQDQSPAAKYAREVLAYQDTHGGRYPAKASFETRTEGNEEGGRFVKEHQQPASSEMLDNVKPVSFDYKPGYGAPGRNYGVLAQDLEKSPMGASLVSKDPQGVRRVDIGKAAMANLGATADLHERVKVLEGGVDKEAQKREEGEGLQMQPPPGTQGVSTVTKPGSVVRKWGGEPANATQNRRIGDASDLGPDTRMVTSDAHAKREVHAEGYQKGLADARNGQINRVNPYEQAATPEHAHLAAQGNAMARSMDAQFAAPPATRQALETTQLSQPLREGLDAWAKRRGVRDLDHPDSHYDYRGAYAADQKAGEDGHWVDTYKQHGHPTFSEESTYSKGSGDGGTWRGDTYVASDEVVKDDIRREGIDPQEAYASRVHELTAMADAGHPEAPGKLLRVREAGAAEGLDQPDGERHLDTLGGKRNDTQAPAGNLLAGPLASGYVMATSTPDPASPEGRAAYASRVMGPPGKAPKKPLRLEADIAAENKAADEALANAPKEPKAPPMMGIGPKGTDDRNVVPEGMMIGPNGGLMPVPKDASTPSEGAVDPATVMAPQGAKSDDKATADAQAAKAVGGNMPLFSPSTTTVVPAHLVDLIGKENWDALSDTQRAEEAAAFDVHMRNAQGAQDEQDKAEKESLHADIRGAIAQDYQNTVSDRGHDLDEKWRGLQEDANKLANYHEDPARFWNSRSTGQQVAALLGVILGGFAAGMHGGQNAALDQMNRAQDKDIEAQRANYQANRDSVSAKRSAYGMAMERYDHDDAKATMAVRLAGQDRITAEARVLAAKHRGTEVDDNLTKLLAAQVRERGQWGISYTKFEQERAVQHGASMQDLIKDYGKYHDIVMEALHKGEGGTPPLPFLEWAQGRLGGIPGLPAGAVVGPHTGKAELLGPMVHTPQGERQARSKEFAADYAQRLEGADELESAVQEIVNIRKKHGGGTWSPADRALARGHAVQSKNAFVKGEGFKRTPAQTEFEALDLIIPPNGAAFSMSTDAQLAAAKKLANRWRENARKNYLVPDSTDAAAKPTPGFKEIKP